MLTICVFTLQKSQSIAIITLVVAPRFLQPIIELIKAPRLSNFYCALKSQVVRG
jgi:hypothetical protein